MPAYRVARKDGEGILTSSTVIGPNMYAALDIAKEADKKAARPGEVFTSYLIMAKRVHEIGERPQDWPKGWEWPPVVHTGRP